MNSALVAVKLLHTGAWAFFAGCVLALPFAAVARQWSWVLGLSGMVLLECLILAVNGGSCPLTAWAARYTDNRSPNFDIYLPAWLARHNKFIFGTIFAFGELLAVWWWFR